MREFQEHPDHDGEDAAAREGQDHGSGDAVNAAFSGGDIEPHIEHEHAEVDDLLNEPPAVPQQVDARAVDRRGDEPRERGSESDHRVEEGDTEEEDVSFVKNAETPDVEAGTDEPRARHIETVAPVEQQTFWRALERSAQQAGNAVTVRSVNPDSDAAREQEFTQYAVHRNIREYNETGARALCSAAQTALSREPTHASDLRISEGNAGATSEDARVTYFSMALSDEAADALLAKSDRRAIELEEPWHASGSAVFSVTTRQEIGREFNANDGEPETPLTMVIKNEFIVRGSEPGVAHWTHMTMDIQRDGTSDMDSFAAISNRLMEPLTQNGIPEESRPTDPTMSDTFFQLVHAMGINSSLTQLSASERPSDQSESRPDVRSDNEEIAQRLFANLEDAGYPPTDATDTHDTESDRTSRVYTEEQLGVTEQLGFALMHAKYDPSDTDAVTMLSENIANCALVNARAGEWNMVEELKNSLDDMEHATFYTIPAATKVLFYQQEIGFNGEASEQLHEQLQFERTGGGDQPKLDIVIGECEKLGLSPIPWIEQYAGGNEDTLRRLIDHYGQDYAATYSDESGEQLTRLAQTLVEDGALSAELICRVVPQALKHIDDPDLQTRLAGKFLEKFDDLDIEKADYDRLLQVGRATYVRLRVELDLQQSAALRGNTDIELQRQQCAAVLKEHVEAFDRTIDKAVSSLGDKGELHFETMLRQYYWSEGIKDLGIEPSLRTPEVTADSIIEVIYENVSAMHRMEGKSQHSLPEDKIIEYRDSLLERLAHIAAADGELGDCQKFIAALSPENQARAYIQFWGSVDNLEDLELLDPDQHSDPDMRKYERLYGDIAGNLEGHYAVSKVLVDDERDTPNLDEEDIPFERHTDQLAQQSREVARTISFLSRSAEVPRPGPNNNVLKHIPLFKTQLGQLLERLNAIDPSRSRDIARELLADEDIKDARDKELTASLASILARSGDPADYQRARNAIINIRGGIQDSDRQYYMLQFAKRIYWGNRSLMCVPVLQTIN